MINTLPRKVLKYIKDNKLTEGMNKITLAVSGGADSVAMMCAFMAISYELGIAIRVHHIEHGIRGEESIQDANFVRDFCQKMNVEFNVSTVDVPAYAHEYGLSIEEAARKLRYQELFAAGYPVATAHTADDNAETVLFNLVRGSGLAGICGIRPSGLYEGLQLIRPMLGITRQEVEEYLKEKDIPFRTDETNYSREYSRNKIRLDVIPILNSINSKAVAHINETAGILYGIKEYQDQGADSLLEGLVEEDGKLKVTELAELPDYLRRSCIIKWLKKETNGAHNIGKVHIEAIEDLVKGPAGKSIDIPGYTLHRGYVVLGIEKGGEKAEPVEFTLEPISVDVGVLHPGQKLSIESGDYEISFKIEDRAPGILPDKLLYLKQLDLDLIKGNIEIRSGDTNDYFILEDGHTKKFNRFCIDEKIPAYERKRIPLLCEGEHILWAVGHRISADYKITDSTRRVLTIEAREI